MVNYEPRRKEMESNKQMQSNCTYENWRIRVTNLLIKLDINKKRGDGLIAWKFKNR